MNASPFFMYQDIYSKYYFYEENKKEKNIDMKNDKYQKEFSNYLNIMNEALEKNDFKAYEVVRDMLDETISECKHEKALMEELNTTNFGILNHIFENELPTLLKTNKKAVRNVIKTIKEDKNLLRQFDFYNVVKNQFTENTSNAADSSVVLENLVNTVLSDIDQKTLNESNRKFQKVMVENNVTPSEFVDSEARKLYENGNIILSTKRNANNIIKLTESCSMVARYMDEHKKSLDEDKSLDKIVEEFENKLKENLTESEISFVQQITDFRTPIAEQRKEKLFNKFKNECISKIDEMLKEDAENGELNGLKEQISSMAYNKESIVKDMAKLLEIRDILMDD